MPTGVYIHTEEHKNKVSKSLKGRFTGENHANWKGDDVGYWGLHTWIRRMEKPKVCAFEDKTCKGRLEWANKSHEYKRNEGDWLRLCISHHRRYDGIMPIRKTV